jgi:hypothetical protein
MPQRIRVSLLAAVMLVSANVLSAAPPTSTPLAAQAAFDNLKSNAPVRWLVRMVAYDPANPVLRIDHLDTLGAPSEDYTFVADHAELRGYGVHEAIRKAGGSLPEGYDVSCVIFPIGKHTIFPASVRGMLQVVQQIDMRRAAQADYRPAPLDELLTPAERNNLAQVDLPSWAWNNYRVHFAGFAQAFATLRKLNASATRYIGHIGPDWCEPGCARILKPHDDGDKNSFSLELPDGKSLTIENFGARVFLIRNVPITQLPGRMLIDFNEPEKQIIPDIDEAQAAVQ